LINHIITISYTNEDIKADSLKALGNAASPFPLVYKAIMGEDYTVQNLRHVSSSNRVDGDVVEGVQEFVYTSVQQTDI